MDNKNLQITNHDFLIYRDSNNDVKVSVMLINNDIWLTQNLIAELFGVGRSTITEHINNILNSGELDENNTVGKTDLDNSKKPVKIYNLDMIIAVGYRVNSKKATNFRIWATKILKEYMTKGFALNDERFINGNKYDTKYFNELLERIKTIRVSERMTYQKITDLFIATATDYNPKSEEAYTFFKIVQNKLHFAISGHTAAELIYSRANSEKKHMGLTSWKKSPNGKIMESDVIIAKNYLNKEELSDLEGIVSAFLEIAENRARRHIPMTMEDWSSRIDKFLLADDRDILKDAGKISHEIACDKALTEFEKYRIKQDKLYKSDFDLLIEETNK